MKIRRAQDRDMNRIDDLLYQVCMIHHEGRPDLFKAGTKKYTREQLSAILNDEKTPVFAAVDDNDTMMGYAFCIFREVRDDNILYDHRTLYIDDLCVDRKFRGQGIGKALFQAVRDFASDNGCDSLTLNVWSCNASALEFYRRCGLTPQKTIMEMNLHADHSTDMK